MTKDENRLLIGLRDEDYSWNGAQNATKEYCCGGIKHDGVRIYSILETTNKAGKTSWR